MKAVILAGGRGERLRPITDTRPKPLVPVLARPVMDYCLSLVAHHGGKKAYITTHYRSEQIRERYGDTAFGMELVYSQEEVPLGTAGGVKRLEEELKEEELFLVLSGDALCDFDLTGAVSFHRRKKADVTVILSSVKTPLEYGVVLSDTMERIFRFSEKPDWSETFSDQVNTGVYILSPRVLERIPADREFDFSHDLFPLLLREGYSLFGYKDEGYWCDIGKIPTLYRCNQDLLQGKARTYLSQEGRILPDPSGKGVYFLSHGASVEEGAGIRSGSVISPGVTLRAGCQVSGSLIFENTKLDPGATVQDAVLCEKVSLEEDSRVLPGSVLGAETVVQAHAQTKREERYAPQSVIEFEEPFAETGLFFTEKGASSGTGVGLDREESERLGNALARQKGGPIGILWHEKNRDSRYFALVLAGGILQGGQDAVLLGEGRREVASFAACRHGIPTVAVTVEKDRGTFYLYEKDGFPTPRKESLKLARLWEDPQHGERTGRILSRETAAEEYVEVLSRVMGEGDGYPLGITGDISAYVKKAAIKSGFAAYDGIREPGNAVAVFSTGVKCYFSGSRLMDTENLRLYLLCRELESGRKTFALPRSSPEIFTKIIEKNRGRVLYFSLGHSSLAEEEARQRGTVDRWLYDNHFLAAEWIRYAKGVPISRIREEMEKIPSLYISALEYHPSEENKAKLLDCCAKAPWQQQGIRIEPGFYGIRIISEAYRFEAALDHAFEYRGKLNEIEKKLRG